MVKIKSGKRANLVDVAKAANVSVMTVSRAVRGIDGVSVKKRAEILKIAKKMGYTPNSSARSLAVSNSDLVGISLPTLYNDVFADMLFGMRQTFENAGFSTVIDTTGYDLSVEQQWVERILSWRPAAMVLTGTDHSTALRDTLRRSGIPTLEIWDTGANPVDINVGIDHENAGHVVGVFARRLGYRRPAFVGAPKGRDPRADKRLAGFAGAFDQKVQTAHTSAHNNFQAGRDGTQELLTSDLRPDVIFYLNDHLAFGGLMACEKAGLNCPRDIGIIGFNALDLTTITHLPMTTVQTPRRLIGVTGARNLLARINGLTCARSVVLPLQLVEGATTRLQ